MFSRFLYLLLSSFLIFIIKPNLLAQPLQERGLLPVINYSAEEYKAAAQNWAAVQDHRGIMYFANNAGILEFDGETWRKLEVTNKSVVRSLAIDASGKIYVGATDEFGFLEATSNGEYVYKSLTGLLENDDKSFVDIWRIQVTADGVFFQSSHKIFQYKENKIIVHQASTKFHRLFSFNGQLLVKQKEIGISIFRDNMFQLLLNSEAFGILDIVNIFPVDEENGIMITEDKGIMSFKITDKKYLVLKHFQTDLDHLFKNYKIESAASLSGGRISLSLYSLGVFILSREGKVLQFINREAGLQDIVVKFQYLDRLNNLWIGLSNGISKIEPNSPITYLNEPVGVNGTIEVILRFNNELYYGGNMGIYYLPIASEKNPLQISSFKQISNNEVWDMHLVNIRGEQSLLVAFENAIYEVTSNHELKEVIACAPWMIKQSQKYPERVYIALDDGLMAIRKVGNIWVNEGKVEDLEDPIRQLVEDKDGNLWLSTQNFTGVVKLNDPGPGYLSAYKGGFVKFNADNGLPEDGFSFAFFENEEPFFGTPKGIFRTDGKILPDTLKWKKFNDYAKGLHRISFKNSQEKWLVAYTDFDQYVIRITGDKWESNTFKKISRNIIHAIYHDENGVTWLGGPKGIFRFDPEMASEFSKPVSVSLRKITSGENQLSFLGVFADMDGTVHHDQLEWQVPVLSFSNNTIAFEYAAQHYDEKGSNLYSYKLEGFDKGWSAWKSETKSVYTNLPEGDYVFRVKAKNLYDSESEETTFQFTILPPWYRTIWAYLGYLLLLGGFVYGAVTISTRSLKAIIKERTAEVVKQKELVEHKNKDIMDSINYAQRIQRAILPTNELLTNKLKETFVLYQPKDVVSGDFYWYTEKGKDVFVAVADCTGHGVPGAFMSMIGSSMLNHAVNEQGVIEAGEILSVVHKGIRHSLKQEETQNRDGMDIALLRFTINDSNEIVKLQYAGANRPIWFFRNGELGEIKATKSSIGGHTSEDQIFTSNEVEFDKGDVFYIFSDGYPDQFGGEKGKKLTTKKLKDLLMLIYKDSMSKQKDHLDKAFSDWKGENEQVDDVCFIGVRV
jgi:serine phosphatase RsbU (regulator of sigma subunit)